MHKSNDRDIYVHNSETKTHPRFNKVKWSEVSEVQCIYRRRRRSKSRGPGPDTRRGWSCCMIWWVQAVWTETAVCKWAKGKRRLRNQDSRALLRLFNRVTFLILVQIPEDTMRCCKAFIYWLFGLKRWWQSINYQ